MNGGQVQWETHETHRSYSARQLHKIASKLEKSNLSQVFALFQSLIVPETYSDHELIANVHCKAQTEVDLTILHSAYLVDLSTYAASIGFERGGYENSTRLLD